MRTTAIKASRLILNDFRGLCRVSGPMVACRWLWCVIKTFHQCRTLQSLSPADAAMGSGPFPAKLGNARGQLYGTFGIAGIREIWARDVYLADGYLSIPTTGTVVDLGANMGNFTVLALAHGKNVKVISVEVQPSLIRKLLENVSANSACDQVTVCNRLIGGVTELHSTLLDEIAADGSARPEVMSEDEFISAYNLTQIDFLKCDIEGSEFGLFRPGSQLLKMTRQLGIEVHGWGGDVDEFEKMLEAEGFEIRRTHDWYLNANTRDRVLACRRKSAC